MRRVLCSGSVECKRQHLMVLHIIALYLQLKFDPHAAFHPRTFIFGGKAAPGYHFAKLMIRLITALAEVINKDASLHDRLKVVFLPNYNVANGQRVYLVTSRHVLIDESTHHRPDRLDIELHSDAENLTLSVTYSVPLYAWGKPVWRQGYDAGGGIDVAVVELDRSRLPPGAVLRAFTPAHLSTTFTDVRAGEPLMVVGFPLGFHDTLHHLPVVRHAAMASSYGMRFGGEGYFLTDARTHRGTSGAPVVMYRPDDGHATLALPWRLLGVHSVRLDVGYRDLVRDESLGLNCAWYADILLTLTQDAEAMSPVGCAA